MMLPVNDLSFRKVMGSFGTGVCVLTLHCPDKGPVGVTINTFSSVSLEPFLVSFCLGKEGLLHGSFLEAAQKKTSFSINILSHSQEALSNQFTRHDPTYWHQQNDFILGPEKTWILKESIGSLVAHFWQTHDAGDHTLFIGEVSYTQSTSPSNPLIYFQSHYRQLSSL